MLQCYDITILQYYNVTILQCYNFEIFTMSNEATWDYWNCASRLWIVIALLYAFLFDNTLYKSSKNNVTMLQCYNVRI